MIMVQANCGYYFSKYYGGIQEIDLLQTIFYAWFCVVKTLNWNSHQIKDSKDQTWPVWKGKFSAVCTSSAKPAAQQTE